MNDATLLIAFDMLYPTMLGWLAAALIPLALHLWNRRRYRETDWAAMRFLLAALETTRRRIRIRQWLLLLLRTMIIILAVLAASEPSVQSAVNLGGPRGHTHRVIVIDGSFSMALGEGDRSLFDEAKQMVTQLVENSPQGDGFTLLLASSPAEAIVRSPVYQTQDFLAELQQLELPDTTSDWAGVFSEVEEVVRAARRAHPRLTREEVYCFTDLQRSGWSDEPGGDATERVRRAASAVAELGRLTVVALGPPAPANRAVTRLAPEAASPTVNQEVLFSATLTAFENIEGNVPVEWYVDGRRSDQTQVSIGDRRQTAMFHYRFAVPGDHHVEVRAAADALPVDDRRSYVVPVRGELQVLCVDGRPSPEALGGATGYLSAALQAAQTGGGRAVEVKVIGEGVLSETALDRYDAVFLCDVAHLTTPEARMLSDYAQRGGGLVIFLGPRVMPEVYNRVLGSDGADLLPVRLGQTFDVVSGRIDPLEYRHPIVQAFRGQENTGLLTIPIDKAMQLLPLEETTTRTVLRLGEGEPLVCERRKGEGTVVLVGTSADRSWTSLPVWVSYVPLVQEMLGYVTSLRHTDRNVTAGTPLSGILERPPSDAVATVSRPDGESAEIPVVFRDGTARWEFDETGRCGVYRVSFGNGEGASEAYAVVPDPAESDLRRWSREEFQDRVLSGVDVELRSREEFSVTRTLVGATYRRRLPVLLLWSAIAVLAVEGWFAWRLGQGG